jgi:hypothetical protein
VTWVAAEMAAEAVTVLRLAVDRKIGWVGKRRGSKVCYVQEKRRERRRTAGLAREKRKEDEI